MHIIAGMPCLTTQLPGNESWSGLQLPRWDHGGWKEMTGDAVRSLGKIIWDAGRGKGLMPDGCGLITKCRNMVTMKLSYFSLGTIYFTSHHFLEVSSSKTRRNASEYSFEL